MCPKRFELPTEDGREGRLGGAGVVPPEGLHVAVLGRARQALQVVLVAHRLSSTLHMETALQADVSWLLESQPWYVTAAWLYCSKQGPVKAPSVASEGAGCIRQPSAHLEVATADEEVDGSALLGLHGLQRAVDLVQVPVAAPLHRNLQPAWAHVVRCRNPWSIWMLPSDMEITDALSLQRCMSTQEGRNCCAPNWLGPFRHDGLSP